jgi:hypothetical protein
VPENINVQCLAVVNFIGTLNTGINQFYQELLNYGKTQADIIAYIKASKE